MGRGFIFSWKGARWAVLAFALVLLVAVGPLGSLEGKGAREGLLDLRASSLSGGKGVRLSGQWLFFKDSLLSLPEVEAGRGRAGVVTVPNAWPYGRGYGTYFLRIYLPADCPQLAIRYTTMSTAFELEVNGALVAQVGRPAATAAASQPRYAPGLATLTLPQAGGSGERVLNLVVRVSNHEYRRGGMWRSLVVGDAAALAGQKRRDDILVYVLVAAFLAMAFNSLVLYCFRPWSREGLYFALLSLAFCLRVLVTGEYLWVDLFPGVGFETLIRLEYLSVALPIPLALQVYWHIYPRDYDGRVVGILSLPFAVLALLVVFAPLPVLTSSIVVFYPLGWLVFLMLFFGGVLPAVFRRRPESGYILAGGLGLFAAFINDSLHATFQIETYNSLGLAYLFFVAMHSIVVARRMGLSPEDLAAREGLDPLPEAEPGSETGEGAGVAEEPEEPEA